MILAAGSVVSAAAAARRVSVLGDFGDQDPGTGSAIQLLGRLVSGNPALVQGAADSDTITVSPSANNTSSGNATRTLLDGQGGDDSYVIQLGNLSGTVQIGDPSGPDAGLDLATVTATSAADVLTISNLQPDDGYPPTGGSLTLASPSQAVQYAADLELLTVAGGDGNDTFFVQPSQTAEITVDGNGPRRKPHGAAGRYLGLQPAAPHLCHPGEFVPDRRRSAASVRTSEFRQHRDPDSAGDPERASQYRRGPDSALHVHHQRSWHGHVQHPGRQRRRWARCPTQR